MSGYDVALRTSFFSSMRTFEQNELLEAYAHAAVSRWLRGCIGLGRVGTWWLYARYRDRGREKRRARGQCRRRRVEAYRSA